MLASKKILPQEVAGAEQSASRGKVLLLLTKSSAWFLPFLPWSFTMRSRKWSNDASALAGSEAQVKACVNCLMSTAVSRLLLIGGVEQLLPIAIPDIEAITQLGGAITFDLGLGM